MKVQKPTPFKRPSWMKGKTDLFDLLVSPTKWEFEKDWDKEEEKVALEGIKI